jgi:hypothetical protein
VLRSANTVLLGAITMINDTTVAYNGTKSVIIGN